MQAKEFWRGLQRGVEVAVAGSGPELLLGVRDGFRRYFHERGPSSPAIAVVPHDTALTPHGLLLSDREMLDAAARRARELAEQLHDSYQFYIGTEGGLESVGGDPRRFFVRSWAFIVSPAGEAAGASGSLQLPARLVHELIAGDPPAILPGTRRSGGLMAALTDGRENRRTATALATFHALSSLFFGAMGGRP